MHLLIFGCFSDRFYFLKPFFPCSLHFAPYGSVGSPCRLSHFVEGEDRPVWLTRVFKARAFKAGLGDGNPSICGIRVLCGTRAGSLKSSGL